jgi:DDE family transposase
MGMLPPLSFRDHFEPLTGPRCPNARCQLIDILVIAICAVICGAAGWEDIEEYGQAQAEWFHNLWICPMAFPVMIRLGGCSRM